VAAVYGSDPQALIAAVGQLRSSRHQVRIALGARRQPAAQLAADTVAEDLAGGKFANLNRVLASASGGPSEWVLLLDDDVELPPRFLDRMIGVAEALELDLAQPAQTRRSDPPWRVTRRRAGVARRTRFVEVGPVVLMRGSVLDQLLPFSEAGMGWGLCLHWAALAERLGWRLGIVDAVAVSHTQRPTASAYSTERALAAAREFLAGHEHIDRRTAGQVIETYRRLPERAAAAQ
jgi:hypothetical protein